MAGDSKDKCDKGGRELLIHKLNLEGVGVSANLLIVTWRDDGRRFEVNFWDTENACVTDGNLQVHFSPDRV